MDRVTLQQSAFNFLCATSLPDTLAHALVFVARRAFRHGLLHGYQTREEARLILEHNAFQMERGTVRATGLLIDMVKLFQEFVTVALQEALRVARDRFGEDYINTLGLPKQGERGKVRLRPDLVWRDGFRCVFVGDAKYKRVDDARIPNADLYQLLAYVTALDLPGGILIYAKGEAEVADYEVRHSGKLLKVSALDLSGSLEAVVERVHSVAEQVRAMRVAASIPAQRTTEFTWTFFVSPCRGGSV